MKLTIMIGCFNERTTILQAIEQAKNINLDKEIIVIDNFSHDGTKEILQSLKVDKEIKIILRDENMGAGTSSLEGIKLAKGEFFFNPGADLEYNMDDVYKMLEKAESENLDAVFGSRLIDKKNVSRYRLLKERPYWLGTIIFTFLVNCLFRKKFTDVLGIHLVKVSVLKKLGFKSKSKFITFALVSKLCKKRHKIGEVPVDYKPRSHKDGKTIRASDMLLAIFTIFKVWILK